MGHVTWQRPFYGSVCCLMAGTWYDHPINQIWNSYYDQDKKATKNVEIGVVRVTHVHQECNNSIVYVGLLFNFKCKLCIYLVPFWVIVSYSFKVVDFYLPNLLLAPSLGITPFKFRQDLLHQKTSLWSIMWHCLHDPKCSCFDIIAACDTDRHTMIAYTMLA